MSACDPKSHELSHACLLYTADLAQLVESHGLHVHLYADDTQVYGFSSPSSAAQLQLRMSACIDDVASWMSSNRLQLRRRLHLR